MDHDTVVTSHRDRGSGEGAYNAEHWLAWLTLFAALLLAAIGVLRGFGMIGGGLEQSDVSTGAPGTQAVSYGAIWDATVWLLPAIALALVAMALHRNEHHRARSPELADDTNEGLWNTEHLLAWVMALATIATAVLGILTGFDVLERGNDQPDALPWLLASIVGGISTATLHAVRHHQMATDEDRIVRIVERRIGTTATAPAVRTTPVVEPHEHR